MSLEQLHSLCWPTASNTYYTITA